MLSNTPSAPPSVCAPQEATVVPLETGEWSLIQPIIPTAEPAAAASAEDALSWALTKLSLALAYHIFVRLRWRPDMVHLQLCLRATPAWIAVVLNVDPNPSTPLRPGGIELIVGFDGALVFADPQQRDATAAHLVKLQEEFINASLPMDRQ